MVARVRRALRMQLLPLGLGFAALAAVVRHAVLADGDAAGGEPGDPRDLRAGTPDRLGSFPAAGRGGKPARLSADGRSTYLDPYRAAVAALPDEIAAIGKTVADNPARRQQLEQLDSATEEKLAEMEEVLRLGRARGLAAAAARVREGRGRVAMDRVRGVVAEMRRDENARLQQRLDISEQADEALRLASLAVLLGVLAVAAYGMAAARRHLRQLLRPRKALRPRTRRCKPRSRRVRPPRRSSARCRRWKRSASSPAG